MYWLDPQQEELILDYFLGRCSPSQQAEAEKLIDHNEAAAQLRMRMEGPLRPLSYHPPVEQCPDRLVEITVERLCQLARQEGCLKPTEPRVIQIGLRRYLRPATTVAAVAACLVLAVGILFSPVHSESYQHPPQASQQNTGGVLNRTSLDGFEWARFYPVDGNQGPVPSPGVPWPGELSSYPSYPLLQQGAPMLPASLDQFQSLTPVPVPNRP